MSPEGLPSGVLGLLKPPGMTSHDAVDTARRTLGMERIGHAGTLDPLAGGVLPLVVGAATRLAEYLQALPKEYRCEFWLGVRSDSGDLEGALESSLAEPLPREDIERALASLEGRQEQVPPAQSARHLGGRRLYELARAGRLSEQERLARAKTVEIYRAALTGLGLLPDGPFAGHQAVRADVRCSSGTYIRALATGLGESLDTFACLAFLLRTECAGFGLDDCATIEELSILGPGVVEHCSFAWRAPSEALWFLPLVSLTSGGVARVRAGGPVPLAEVVARREAPPSGEGAAGRGPSEVGAAFGLVRLVDQSGTLLALGHEDGERIRPHRVFGTP